MPDETIVADIGTEAEAPVLETAETDISTEVQDGAEQQRSTQDAEGQAAKTTAAADPLKDAFTKLKATDAKAEAFLRKEFFSAKQKLQEAQEQIELLGGEEGIAEMQSELQEYAETLTQVAEGNPLAIDKVLQDSREGYLKLAQAALDKMPSVDPVRYEQTMIPHVAQYLADKGMTEATSYALAMLKENKPGEAQRALEDMAGWLGRLSKLAENKQKASQDDPEKQSLRDQLAKSEQEKSQRYQGDVDRSVATSINAEIKKHIDPLLREAAKSGRGLTAEQRQGIVSDAYNYLAKAIHGQARTQQQLKAFMRKRSDPAEIARFLASKINSRDAEGKTLTAKAIKAAWESRGFGTAPAPSNGTRTQVVQTKGKPRAEDIDWDKDPGRTLYMQGKAYLKKGGMAQWDWSAL